MVTDNNSLNGSPTSKICLYMLINPTPGQLCILSVCWIRALWCWYMNTNRGEKHKEVSLRCPKHPRTQVMASLKCRRHFMDIWQLSVKVQQCNSVNINPVRIYCTGISLNNMIRFQRWTYRVLSPVSPFSFTSSTRSYGSLFSCQCHYSHCYRNVIFNCGRQLFSAKYL